MPLNFQPIPVLKMACIQSPFLVPLGIVGSALVNNEVFKAFTYLVGLMFLFAAHLALAPSISGSSGRRTAMKGGPKAFSKACDAFAIWPGSNYTTPAWSTSSMSFAFAYLLTPQIYNGYPASPFFFVLFGGWILMDIIVRKNMGCAGDDGFIPGLVGLAFGGVAGIIYFFIVHAILPSFTFFNDPEGNRLKCNKPKKNHMKCTVYKNGIKAGSING